MKNLLVTFYQLRLQNNVYTINWRITKELKMTSYPLCPTWVSCSFYNILVTVFAYTRTCRSLLGWNEERENHCSCHKIAGEGKNKKHYPIKWSRICSDEDFDCGISDSSLDCLWLIHIFQEKKLILWLRLGVATPVPFRLDLEQVCRPVGRQWPGLCKCFAEGTRPWPILHKWLTG